MDQEILSTQHGVERSNPHCDQVNGQWLPQILRLRAGDVGIHAISQLLVCRPYLGSGGICWHHPQFVPAAEGRG